jgi:hypothetical protein
MGEAEFFQEDRDILAIWCQLVVKINHEDSCEIMAWRESIGPLDSGQECWYRSGAEGTATQRICPCRTIG